MTTPVYVRNLYVCHILAVQQGRGQRQKHSTVRLEKNKTLYKTEDGTNQQDRNMWAKHKEEKMVVKSNKLAGRDQDRKSKAICDKRGFHLHNTTENNWTKSLNHDDADNVKQVLINSPLADWNVQHTENTKSVSHQCWQLSWNILALVLTSVRITFSGHFKQKPAVTLQSCIEQRISTSALQSEQQPECWLCLHFWIWLNLKPFSLLLQAKQSHKSLSVHLMHQRCPSQHSYRIIRSAARLLTILCLFLIRPEEPLRGMF